MTLNIRQMVEVNPLVHKLNSTSHCSFMGFPSEVLANGINSILLLDATEYMHAYLCIWEHSGSVLCWNTYLNGNGFSWSVFLNARYRSWIKSIEVNLISRIEIKSSSHSQQEKKNGLFDLDCRESNDPPNDFPIKLIFQTSSCW